MMDYDEITNLYLLHVISEMSDSEIWMNFLKVYKFSDPSFKLLIDCCTPSSYVGGVSVDEYGIVSEKLQINPNVGFKRILNHKCKDSLKGGLLLVFYLFLVQEGYSTNVNSEMLDYILKFDNAIVSSQDYTEESKESD